MFKNMHFKKKIFLSMLCVSYFTVFILSVVIYNIFQTDTKEKMIDSYILNVDLISNELEYIFSDMRYTANEVSSNSEFLTMISNYEAIENNSQTLSQKQAIENYLPQKANNYPIEFKSFVCTLDGNIFYSGAQEFFFGYNPEEILKEEWFLLSTYEKLNNSFFDSSEMFDNEENNSNFYVVRDITNVYTGGKIGVLRIGFDSEYIKYKLDEIVPVEYTSYILNDDGYVIYSSDSLLVGSYIEYDAQNSNEIIISSEISNTPWKLLISIPQRSLVVGIEQIFIGIFIVVLLCLILSSILAFFLSNSIIIPINKLIKKVKSIDKSGYANVEEFDDSIDEIQILEKTIDSMSSEIDNMMESLIKKEQEKTQAEVKFLRTQINPHFLHNTLKTLPQLVKEGRNEENTSIVSALTSILKESMVSTASMIKLSKEIELLRSYLVIMQIRYDYTFDFSIECQDSLSDILIPRLSLQPLLENAVFHGVDSKNPNYLYIKLQVKPYEGNRAHIQIIDNGKGIEKKRLKMINDLIEKSDITTQNEDSIGIPNVAKRLKFYYNNKNVDMYFESKNNKGTCVNLIIPIIKGGSDESFNS